MGDNDHNVEKNNNKGRSIPVDIIINILSRVPGSSLIRFRCVCKLWKSLTYDPHFIDLHLEHARKVSPPCIITLSNKYPSADVCLTFLDEAWEPKRRFSINSGVRFNMTPSCNGLLCVYNTTGDLVQLCNPTTRELLTLPAPTWGYSIHSVASCYFGFHPVTKEYKVVRTLFHVEHETVNMGCECVVFTLGTGLWRQIGSIDYGLCGRGITLNGAMYWLKSSSNADNEIVSLDLKAERFIPVSAPDFEGYERASLVLLEGSVCLAGSPWSTPGPMDIWMLKDCIKHVWIHKYRILVHTTSEILVHTPIVIQKGKIILKSFQRLCYHNLENMSENCEGGYHDEHMCSANVHVESLVSLANR